MRGTTAFDHIDDPSDPAWSGFADLVDGERPSRRGMLLLAISVGVVLVLLGVAVSSLGSDGDGGAGSAAPAAKVGPKPVPAAIVPPPVDPAASIPEASRPSPPPTAPSVQKPAAPALGSGWAPAAATRSPSTSGRLTGDLAGIAPSLIAKLDQLAIAIDRDIEIVSGWRRHAEQQELYERFLSGTGNLAAVPGTSRHETGMAADVYVDGVALANVEGAAEAAARLGMHFPVPGEPWHLEPVVIQQ